jgi:hypothetical protein
LQILITEKEGMDISKTKGSQRTGRGAYGLKTKKTFIK